MKGYSSAGAVREKEKGRELPGRNKVEEIQSSSWR